MTPELLHGIAAVLNAVVWPVTLLVVLVGYRKQFVVLLESIESIKFPIGEAKLRIRLEKESERSQGKRSEDDVPSDEVLEAAQRIDKLAADVDIGVVARQIHSLAREFEGVRASMRQGPQRTKHQDAILKKLKLLGLAMRPLLPTLVDSERVGDHLAAVAGLQVAPSEDYFDWLANQTGSQARYIAYHAAVALASAARLATTNKDIKNRLRSSIDSALKVMSNRTQDEIDKPALVLLNKIKVDLTSTGQGVK